jgi:hypothetical protein
VDPHWLQCGSGSSFLSQYRSISVSDPVSQNNADPDPGQNLKSQKVEFSHEKYTKVGNRSKNIPTKVQKPFWTENQVYLFILVNLDGPGSESRTAK